MTSYPSNVYKETYFGLVRDADGLYRIRGQLCVPDEVAHQGLCDEILHEFHYSRIMAHPKSLNMYLDLC